MLPTSPPQIVLPPSSLGNYRVELAFYLSVRVGTVPIYLGYNYIAFTVTGATWTSINCAKGGCSVARNSVPTSNLSSARHKGSAYWARLQLGKSWRWASANCQKVFIVKTKRKKYKQKAWNNVSECKIKNCVWRENGKFGLALHKMYFTTREVFETFNALLLIFRVSPSPPLKKKYRFVRYLILLSGFLTVNCWRRATWPRVQKVEDSMSGLKDGLLIDLYG